MSELAAGAGICEDWPVARRRLGSMWDLGITLAVIMVPVVLLTLLMSRTPEGPPVTPVDWKPVAQKARAEAGWPVLTPAGLPEQGDRAWTVTKANWVKTGEPALNGDPSPRNEWELGMLSPDKIMYAVEQGDGPAGPFVEEATRRGAVEQAREIQGRHWQLMNSPDGRTKSLVARDAEVTTVVSADTDVAHLEQFARTLTDH